MNIFQSISSFFKQHYFLLPSSHSGQTAQYWNDSETIIFVKHLKQVITWTEKLSKDFDFVNGFYGTVFRQTNPLINGVQLYNIDGDYATWNLDDYNEKIYEELLQLVIRARPADYDVDLTLLDNLGRILSFQTCCTTHDGAPIVESQCFVDEGDVPPIDTWFFLKRNYYHGKCMCPQTLFAWIPKPFEKVMQAAIDVEIFDSYRWLDENDKQLYDRIKNIS